MNNICTCDNKWKAYPANKPTEYGRYLVHRKDGKIHIEIWNNTGWAYNDKVITFFVNRKPPCNFCINNNKI